MPTDNVINRNFEDLFSIGEKKRVGKERRMYVHFKIKNKKLSEASAKDTLDRIFDYTNVYNEINKPLEYSSSSVDVKKILIAIKSTNMNSIYPFLMALLKSKEKEAINEKETIELLRETYVLLVRRKFAKLPVAKYDTFFPSLLDKIINEPNKIKAFHTQIQTEQLWVSDQVFQDAFLTKEIYNSRELNFSRLVLQEIDKHMHPFGELPDYSTIHTIERILHQTLDNHWKNYLINDALNINLPTITNILGNLSLNSVPANNSFGQKPFVQKQLEYTISSALARDVKDRTELWNIQAIEERGRDLSKIALKVWKWNV